MKDNGNSYFDLLCCTAIRRCLELVILVFRDERMVVCTLCGLLDANQEHPDKLCVYCVLQLNRRIETDHSVGEEAPGIGDNDHPLIGYINVPKI